jgi:hypothetical protein
MGELMPKGTKRDDLSDVVRGLTMLLRKPLHVDPLAEAKPVAARVVIEQPAQDEPRVPAGLPARASIVPSAKPKRTAGKGQLKPDEGELA